MIEANPPVQGEQLTLATEPRRQWLMYNCQFCGHRMVGIRQGTSENKRTGQQYIHSRYCCPRCDYWMTTEIPRKIAATIVDEECFPPVDCPPTIKRSEADKDRDEPAEDSATIST